MYEIGEDITNYEGNLNLCDLLKIHRTSKNEQLWCNVKRLQSLFLFVMESMNFHPNPTVCVTSYLDGFYRATMQNVWHTIGISRFLVKNVSFESRKVGVTPMSQRSSIYYYSLRAFIKFSLNWKSCSSSPYLE